MLPQDRSTNVSRSHSNAKLRRKASNYVATQMTDGLRPPPLAVQSMLRTTTEVGDVGELDGRIDLRHPMPRLQSTRPRSGSFDTSFASALRYYESPRKLLDRRQLVHRYQPARSSRPTRYGMANPGLPRERVGPRSANRHIKTHDTCLQGLANHPSSLQGRRSLMTLRSYARSKLSETSSPYHLHHSRPSHSQSFHSTMPRSGRARRSYWSPVRSRQSIASLPTKNFGQRRTCIDNYAHNPSTTSSLRLPSSAVSLASASVQELPLHLQARTPNSTFLQHFRTLSDSRRGSDKELVTSVSSSSIPRYYDYSESFHVEDYFLPRIKHISPSNSQSDISHVVPFPLFQTQTTMDEFQIGSVALPAELPTKHNRRSSEQSDSEGESDVFELDSIETNRNIALLSKGFLNEGREESTEIARMQHAMYKQTFPQGSSVAPIHFCKSPRVSTFFPHGERSERNLNTLVARVHSPEKSDFTKDKTSLTARNSAIADTFRSLARPEVNSEITIPAASDFNPAGTKTLAAECLEPKKTQIAKLQNIASAQPHRASKFTQRQIERLAEATREIAEEHSQSDDSNTDGSVPSGHDSALVKLGLRLDHRVHKKLEDQSYERRLLDNAVVPETRKTPRRVTHAVTISSNGKSTIDSLLDKHIESLGLMPEPDSPCEYPNQPDLSMYDCKSDDACIIQPLGDIGRERCDIQSRPLDSYFRRTSSLDSKTISDLKPSRLFMSMDRRRSVASEPGPMSMSLRLMQMGFSSSQPSSGWQTLPSTSRERSLNRMSKHSLTSGEMADIDTNVRSLTVNQWSYSQFNLPTSLDETIDAPVVNTWPHRRNWVVDVERQQAQARRRMGVCVRPQVLRSKSDEALYCLPSSKILRFRTLTSMGAPATVPMWSSRIVGDTAMRLSVKSHGNSFNTVDHEIKEHRPIDGKPTTPSRWSDMIAAMPLPRSNPQLPYRKASTKTQRSQRSQRSYQNIVEPLNSSQHEVQVAQLLNIVPRLAPPDLGPPLTTSMLNSSLPYAETPSTIHLSPYNMQSFFDDGPGDHSRKRSKTRLGLHSLHSFPYGSRIASLPVGLNKLNQGCQVRNKVESHWETPRRSSQSSGALDASRTISKCAYRRKKVVKRMKDWWKATHFPRKNCSIKRKRATYTNPGGVLE